MACTVAISPVMIIRVQTPITTSYPVLAREEYRDLSLRSRDNRHIFSFSLAGKSRD